MDIIEIDNPKLEVSLVKFQKIESSPRECYEAVYESSYILAYEVAKNLEYYDTKIRTVDKQEIIAKNLNYNFRVFAHMKSGLPMEKPFLDVLRAHSICHFEFDGDKLIIDPLPKQIVGEKVILLEPVLHSLEVISCVVKNIIASGISEKNIILACLVASPQVCESLLKTYKEIQIITGICTNNFAYFDTDNPYEDWVSYYLFGGKNKITDFKKSYLRKMYELY